MASLIICEKPKVAEKLAAALSEGEVRRDQRYGVTHFRLVRGGKELIIAPAVGHIYTLKQKTEGGGYPVFDIEWAPSWQVDREARFTKDYLSAIESLAKEADEFVNACDFDVEGCLPEYEKVVVEVNGEKKLVCVGDFIDGLFATNPVFNSNGFEFASVGENAKILLADSRYHSSFGAICKVMRRKGDGKILRITTEYGRKIHVTGNHPVFRLSRDGVETICASDLKAGDFVPVVKHFKTGANPIEIDLIEHLKDDKRRFYVYGVSRKLGIMPAEMSRQLRVSRKTCLGWRFSDRMPLWAYLRLENDKRLRRIARIGVYKSKTTISAITKLDNTLGRLVGYYLAEGCIDSSGFVGWYFGGHEKNLADDVENMLIKFIGSVPKKRLNDPCKGRYGVSTCFEVGTKSAILRIFFEEILETGPDSHKKRIPRHALSSSDFAAGLIDGYFTGDGSIFVDTRDNRTVVSAGTVNEELQYGFHQLLLLFGINSSLVDKDGVYYLHLNPSATRKLSENGMTALSTARRISPAEPNERAATGLMDFIPNLLLSESDVVNKVNFRRNSRTSIDNVTNIPEAVRKMQESDVHFLKVRSIAELDYDGFVYDFETESHNFSHGNGLITHNSLIGANVIQYACNTPLSKAKRMKFSALTSDDLIEAYENLLPLDELNAIAGEARHMLDWFWGINLSRALMHAVRSAGMYKVLSVGRVQGPSLHMLAKRELEIQKFRPEPYWQLFAIYRGLKFQHELEKFFKKEEAEERRRISDANKANGIVDEVTRTRKKLPPNPPFDLTSLQVEAFGCFGFSPAATLAMAQTLYEASLISYPRTSSQKLPAKLNFPKILNKLAQNPAYSEKAKKLISAGRFKPHEGAKEDSAHPAIHPTGLMASGERAGEKELRLYDLIVKRFLACFAEFATREGMRVDILLGLERYFITGARTVEKGWIEFYEPYAKFEEVVLPDLAEKTPIVIEKIEMPQKETQPPKRYTEASIIQALEKANLGTKSTRAVVIETLRKRGYMTGKKALEVTPFGLSVNAALGHYCREILDEKLTMEFEEKMDGIAEGKIEEDEVIHEAEGALEVILDKFKRHESAIGKELVGVFKEQRAEEQTLGKCPTCKTGDLRIMRGRATGKQFAACSNYPQCKQSYPLPQNALIIKTPKVCEKCGTPIYMVRRKGRRDFEMCLDPKCPTKAGWGKPKPPVKKVEEARKPAEKKAEAVGALGEAGGAKPAVKKTEAPADAQPKQAMG